MSRLGREYAESGELSECVVVRCVLDLKIGRCLLFDEAVEERI